MKGRNWRDFEPPEKRRRQSPPKRKHSKHKKRRRRKKGLLHRLVVFVLLFTVGYCGFYVYYRYGKPYTVALDAGHGGDDVGAEGIIQEVELTEQTVSALADLLKADGRFRVVRSRRNNETKSITDRSRKFEKVKPDLVLSVHGNAEDSGTAYGFECYPAVPGMKNHEKSMQFAEVLANEMGIAGNRLRGENGIRFGYYVKQADGATQKVLFDASDTQVYENYDTFGILKNVDCAAVLVEQCFVTNENDVAQFGTESGCQKAAEAYYRAIVSYLEIEKDTK